MPKPFLPLTLDQFADHLNQFQFRRRINEVHLHHTWRPNHADFARHPPEACIEGMWRSHTQERGFSDIAQHVTVDPRGIIWTGRDWNTPPASATGFNGTYAVGPFMIETIGDFDTGHDPFEDPQKAAVLGVIARVQARFKLDPEALRFHNQMSSKTCPGTQIQYDPFLEEVRATREQLSQADGAPAKAPEVSSAKPGQTESAPPETLAALAERVAKIEQRLDKLGA